MEKKDLESLVSKKQGETTVVSVRVPIRVKKALDAKGIDIAETIRNVLLRLTDK